MQNKTIGAIIILIFILALGFVIGAMFSKLFWQTETGRYYHDMDYSKDKYIDYWNDMWAECEFGEKNYEAIRKEYGIN